MSLVFLKLAASGAGTAIGDSAKKACSGTCGGDLNALFPVIANTLIFIVGAISVIMIIVGGLRYVISNGDPKQTATAKDTILYAVVGVVVSMMSFAIIRFVVSKF